MSYSLPDMMKESLEYPQEHAVTCAESNAQLQAYTTGRSDNADSAMPMGTQTSRNKPGKSNKRGKKSTSSQQGSPSGTHARRPKEPTETQATRLSTCLTQCGKVCHTSSAGTTELVCSPSL